MDDGDVPVFSVGGAKLVEEVGKGSRGGVCVG
jgi:hypothetical protein